MGISGQPRIFTLPQSYSCALVLFYLLQVNLVKKCGLLVQCWLDADLPSHAMDAVQHWLSTIPTSLAKDKGNITLLVGLFVKTKRALIKCAGNGHANAASK